MSSTINASTASGGGLVTSADASGILQLQTAGVTALTIDASQNVGIGTSSPAAKLDVSTSINLGLSYLNVAYDIGGGSGWLGGYNVTYSAGVKNVATGTLSAASYQSGGVVFYTNTSSAAGTVASERMRIDASGNVGIGTSSPNKQLQIQYGSTNSGQLQITNNSTGTTATDGVLFGYDTSNDVIINNQEATATKLYTSGTERMRIDSSGNVGIGTGSSSIPAALVVAGDIWSKGGLSTGAVGILSADPTSGANGVTLAASFVAGGYGPLIFKTGNAEKVRIDASGNVGIGTISTSLFNSVGGSTRLAVCGSSASTDILGNTNASICIINTDTTANNTAGLHFARADTDDTPNLAGASIVAQFPDTQVTNQYPKGLLAFLTSTNANAAPSEKMRIDSSGNVGIGTSSPSKKLSINGDFRLGDGGGTGAIFTDATVGLRFMLPAAGTSNTESMRIDALGNLLVGTTSGAGRLVVSGPSNASTSTVQVFSNVTGDTAYVPLLISKYDNNTTTSQVFIRFAVNNNTIASGQINANGASAAAFGNWSDARLKENIELLHNQLENICALKPSEFDYKDGSGHQVGFIAQEMKEVYPDVVGEGENGMLMITGWSKTEARLVKAIQELKAIIDTQNDTINNLTTRLETLEGVV